MTTERANRAKRLLNHYLRMAVEGSGQRCWDSDNTAEVDDIVDSIIDAATATPAQPAEPDALTRIAVALERSADALERIASVEEYKTPF